MSKSSLSLICACSSLIYIPPIVFSIIPEYSKFGVIAIDCLTNNIKGEIIIVNIFLGAKHDGNYIFVFFGVI